MWIVWVLRTSQSHDLIQSKENSHKTPKPDLPEVKHEPRTEKFPNTVYPDKGQKQENFFNRPHFCRIIEEHDTTIWMQDVATSRSFMQNNDTTTNNPLNFALH